VCEKNYCELFSNETHATGTGTDAYLDSKSRSLGYIGSLSSARRTCAGKQNESAMT
jgi:hypothetical protein